MINPAVHRRRIGGMNEPITLARDARPRNRMPISLRRSVTKYESHAIQQSNHDQHRRQHSEEPGEIAISRVSPPGCRRIPPPESQRIAGRPAGCFSANARLMAAVAAEHSRIQSFIADHFLLRGDRKLRGRSEHPSGRRLAAAGRCISCPESSPQSR